LIVSQSAGRLRCGLDDFSMRAISFLSFTGSEYALAKS
jgi:hypothetical protein